MSDNAPQREMTLEEWVDRLPPVHLARKELASLRAQLSEARAAAEVLAAFSMRCVAALQNAHNAIRREAWQEGPSIEEAASALQQQIDAPTAPLDRVAGAFRFVERNQ